MESLIENIVKETQGQAKLKNVCSAAEKAKEFLNSYSKAPSSEYRKQILPVVTACLDSANQKQCQNAKTILHKLGRDNRFHESRENETEQESFTSQVVESLHNLVQVPNDHIQADILQAVLYLSYQPFWITSGQVTLQIVCLCEEVTASHGGSAAAKAAAQNTSSSCLASFAKQINTGDKCADEIIPILQYIVSRIEENFRDVENGGERRKVVSKQPPTRDYLLSCLEHTLLSLQLVRAQEEPQPEESEAASETEVGELSKHFSTFVWRSLCPAIIRLLIRGKGQNVATSTVLLLGPHETERPVLEAIFDRLLVQVPADGRLSSLKAVNKLLGNSRGLNSMAIIVNKHKPHQEDRSVKTNDMSLLIMLFECLDEWTESQADGELLYECLTIIQKILRKCQNWCKGSDLGDSAVQSINQQYGCIKDCDYVGPYTYTANPSIPEEFRKITVQDTTANSESDNGSIDSGSVDPNGGGVDSAIGADRDSLDSVGRSAGGADSFDSSDSSNDTDEPDEKELYLQKYVKGQGDLGENADGSSLTPGEERIPPYLHSPRVGSGWRSMSTDCSLERENADMFCKVLRNRLARLNSIRSAAEIDQKIQEFATQFCQDFSSHSPRQKKEDHHSASSTILSGDGVYLTCYAAILLSVKLRCSNYFEEEAGNRMASMSEEEFHAWILERKAIVFVSPVWLSQVYTNLTTNDLFEGIKISSPMVNICLDMEWFSVAGVTNDQDKNNLLAEFRRSRTKQYQDISSEQVDAGRKVTRKLLTAIWDYTVAICSKPQIISVQELKTSISLLNPSAKARKSKNCLRELETINLSILQMLVELSIEVGLQHLAGSVLRTLLDIAFAPAPKRKKSYRNRCQANRLFSVECVLVNSIHLAGEAQGCWKHIFQCCRQVHCLEQSLFQPQVEANSQNGRSQTASVSSTSTKVAPEGSSKEVGDLNLDFGMPANYEEIWLGFVSRPKSQHYESLQQLYQQEKVDIVADRYLSQEVTAKAICYLSHLVESLYSQAASRLNLQALVGFLQELVFQSHKQLIQLSRSDSLKPGSATIIKSSPEPGKSDVLLITQLSESILQIVKSGRPLLHIILSWAIVGPHLVQGGAHTDSHISKSSIQAIHNMITTFLHHHSEMAYFRVNEALFKPFETLIMLELCDSDRQDQIISSIQDFVESSPADIRSGWRPLFGALRSIPIQYTAMSSSLPVSAHITGVLDVFEAFLSTDNPVVFAHAALTCIMCLIKYIKGSKEQRDLEEVVDIREMCLPSTGLVESALGYIVRCHSILAKMYLMPACPVFWGSEKIHTGSQPVTVHYSNASLEVISFDPSTDTLLDFPFSFPNVESTPPYANLLKSSGLLRVWFLLVDGLVSALPYCPMQNQAATIDTLFSILQSMKGQDYISFGIFCVNHLLMPSIQNWMRDASSEFAGWMRSAQGIKQTVGMTTDLVLDWIKDSSSQHKHDARSGLELLLRQLAIILTDATTVSSEVIARLATSCFKHLLQESSLKPEHTDLVIIGLCRSLQVSLFPLHQLMASFQRGSTRFYGDIGSVKVAARRDSTLQETHRMSQLAHQALLYASQRNCTIESPPSDNPDSEDRSYLFLLQPTAPLPASCQAATAPTSPTAGQQQDVLTVRVTLRDLVTGLTAHSLLLQILEGQDDGKYNKDLIKRLTARQIEMILITLRQSGDAALEFDDRPGLKFLIQKVAQIPSAANLYQQTRTSWILRMALLLGVTQHLIEQSDGSDNSNQNSGIALSDWKGTLDASHVSRMLSQQDGHYKRMQSLERCDFVTSILHLHQLMLDLAEKYTEVMSCSEQMVESASSAQCQPKDLSNGQKALTQLLHIMEMLNSESKAGAATATAALPENENNQAAQPATKSENETEDDLQPRSDIELTEEQAGDASEGHDGLVQPTLSPKVEVEEINESQVEVAVTETFDSAELSGQEEDQVNDDNELEKERDDATGTEEITQNDAPFQFSDFLKQPLRSDSPNLSQTSENPNMDDIDTETSANLDKDDIQDKEILRNNETVNTHMSGESSGQPANKRANPFDAKVQTSAPESCENTDPELEEQKNEAIKQDRLLKERVWNEILEDVFSQIHHLNPQTRKILLPALLPGLESMANRLVSLKPREPESAVLNARRTLANLAQLMFTEQNMT